jgi:xanthine dehydrogenase accessory factor
MRRILRPVSDWLAAGKPVALARVVEVVGSGVHPAGAAIAVNSAGDVVGSATGGCVEGALVEEARAALAGAGPPRLRTFGCSDDEAFDVGLSCGGLVRVLIERLVPPVADEGSHWQPDSALSWLAALAEAVHAGKGVALLEVIDGPEELLGHKAVIAPVGSALGHEQPGGGALDGGDGLWLGLEPGREGVLRAVTADALADLAAERSAPHRYMFIHQGQEAGITVFVDSFPAPRQMLVVGAASYAAALTAQAKLLGYHVVVCDPRAVFASASRLPLADDVVVEWPDRYLGRVGPTFAERDAICVLTHDAKFDIPTILSALSTRAGYIGVMGSRRTQADRRQRLVEAGVSEAQLVRLRGPLGLDLGANSPEETAVSICAEIIAVQHGRSGGPLAASHNPIHPADPAPAPGSGTPEALHRERPKA